MAIPDDFTGIVTAIGMLNGRSGLWILAQDNKIASSQGFRQSLALSMIIDGIFIIIQQKETREMTFFFCPMFQSKSAALAKATASSKRAAIEKRDADFRKKEEFRENILRNIKHDSILMANAASDCSVEQKRRLKQVQAEKEERMAFEKILQEQEQAAAIKEQTERENELVMKMEARQRELLREQKLRQSIKEGSPELRELEKKLNYAYMNKERYLQIKEKNLLREKANAEAALKHAEFLENESKSKKAEEEAQEQNHVKIIAYQKALSQQLEENQEKKREDYERFLKEKAMIDDIIKKINEENQREAESRLQKRKETKQYVEKFIADREEWKRAEQARQDAENQKIQEYARLQAEREDLLLIKKKELEAGKGAIYEKLAEEMEANEKARLELENLRIELAQEEQESAARERDREAMQDRIKKRFEAIAAYQAQIAEKRLLAEEERKAEDLYRQQLMKKFAEDDRIEQMKQTARRMKQLEHRRAVDALIQEHRLRRQKDIEEEKKLIELDAELEKFKAEVIEQERQRLLRDHASKLVGFLPKGVLRDEKDLEIFDREFKKKFNQ